MAAPPRFGKYFTPLGLRPTGTTKAVPVRPRPASAGKTVAAPKAPPSRGAGARTRGDRPPARKKKGKLATFISGGKQYLYDPTIGEVVDIAKAGGKKAKEWASAGYEWITNPSKKQLDRAAVAQRRMAGRYQSLKGSIPSESRYTGPEQLTTNVTDPRVGRGRTHQAMEQYVPRDPYADVGRPVGKGKRGKRGGGGRGKGGKKAWPKTAGLPTIPGSHRGGLDMLRPGPDSLGRHKGQRDLAQGLLDQRTAAARRNESGARQNQGGRSGPLTYLSQAKPGQLAVKGQRMALNKLMGVVDEGGLTAIDRARIEAARRNEDQYLRGQREATLANMQARGMAGSGTELMSQLAAQQESGQRLSAANLATEAQAQQRAMQAIGMLGDQSGRLRDDTYQQSLNLAKAKDNMRKWNKEMLVDYQRYLDDVNRWNAQQRTQHQQYQDNERWRQFAAQQGITDRQAGIDQMDYNRNMQAAADARGFRDKVVGAGINAGMVAAGAPPVMSMGGGGGAPSGGSAWQPSFGGGGQSFFGGGQPASSNQQQPFTFASGRKASRPAHRNIEDPWV